jgi:ATP/ADP translocase
MKESLKVLLSSRYVRDLATLVVAYGISINLVEVTWKSKLKAQVILLIYLFFSYCVVPTVIFSVFSNIFLIRCSSLVQMNTHLSWVISQPQLELQLSR